MAILVFDNVSSQEYHFRKSHLKKLGCSDVNICNNMNPCDLSKPWFSVVWDKCSKTFSMSSHSKCKNGGKYIKSIKSCVCRSGYYGNNCSIKDSTASAGFSDIGIIIIVAVVSMMVLIGAFVYWKMKDKNDEQNIESN